VVLRLDVARSESEAAERHEADLVEPTAPSPAPRGAFAAAADVALLGASALVIAFCLAQILVFDYGRDQGIYAMVGRAIAHGEMPYRDAWDFKPPGIFLVYALSRALFGASQRGIRVLEVLALAGMIGAMIRLARDAWGDARIGVVGGAIAALVHAQLDFWHTAQPESFGGVLTIFALVLGLRAPAAGARPARADLVRWAGAGALLGFAGLLKPPLAGGALPLALYHLARARRDASLGPSPLRRAGAWAPVVALAAGGAAPIVLTLSWFAARGALGDLHRVLLVFTPHYTALSWVGETVMGMVYWGFTEWLQQYCSVATVGFLLLLALQPTPRARPGVLVVGGVIAIHVAGVILQGKFFPYHYGATWPLTALLAGFGWVRLFDLAVRRGPAGAALFALAIVAVAFGRTATKDTPDSFLERCAKRLELALHRRHDVAGWDALASVADVNAGANRAVAAFLREHVAPERAVFVWGFEPVIYDLADRRPATRFLYDVPQRVEWAKRELREVMMRDLETTPPAAIVVERRDVLPMVTGSNLDSADTLPDFPALQGLLATRYARATTIEDFDVYVERGR
jgi:hypothetical protein